MNFIDDVLNTQFDLLSYIGKTFSGEQKKANHKAIFSSLAVSAQSEKGSQKSHDFMILGNLSP